MRRPRRKEQSGRRSLRRLLLFLQAGRPDAGGEAQKQDYSTSSPTRRLESVWGGCVEDRGILQCGFFDSQQKIISGCANKYPLI